MGRRRRLSSKVAVSAITTIACMAAAETVARVATRSRPPFGQRAFERTLNSAVVAPDPRDARSRRWGHAPVPGSVVLERSADYDVAVRVNEDGFRGRALADADPGLGRVLLLGDSMVWGMGVAEEDTTCARLEARAAEQGAPLAAYNRGLVGLDTAQELVVLRDEGARARPDHVVLVFFCANDPLPNTLGSVSPLGWSPDGDAVSALRSEVDRALRPVAWSAALREPLLPPLAVRLRYALTRRDDVVARSAALVAEVEGEARSLGARFTVVMLHARDAVRGGALERWSGSRDAASALRRAFEEQGLEVVDLLDHWRGAEAAARHYFAHDGHLSPAGHDALAAIVLDHLRRGPRA